MRLPDWDRRLAAAIEKHIALPGAWGVSDCWMLDMDAIEAVTGAPILPKLRRYRTEAAGYRLFAKHGFTTVEEALASVLPTVGRLSAQRGDVGVIEREGLMSCGVFDAGGFVVKTLFGEGTRIDRAEVRHFEVTAVKTAFKVGR